MSTCHLVYISVGSNIGDRLAHCRKGLEDLEGSGETTVRRYSSFYQTEPVDFTDQAWFVNAVAEVASSLSPLALLEKLQSVQRRAGRSDKGVRFGPRPLDLDILLYDDQVMATPTLTIPHPRMHRRRFVLRPICDINPELIHPVLNKTMAVLLNGLDEAGQEVIVHPGADCLKPT